MPRRPFPASRRLQRSGENTWPLSHETRLNEFSACSHQRAVVTDDRPMVTWIGRRFQSLALPSARLVAPRSPGIAAERPSNRTTHHYRMMPSGVREDVRADAPSRSCIDQPYGCILEVGQVASGRMILVPRAEYDQKCVSLPGMVNRTINRIYTALLVLHT